MGKTGKNRATLLVDLIRENGNDNADLFDLLVPHMYGELYSLYCILHKSDVLDECGFNDPPMVSEGVLTIRLTLPKNDRKQCVSYMESKENLADYLKKDRFELKTSQDSSSLFITFIRLSEE